MGILAPDAAWFAGTFMNGNLEAESSSARGPHHDRRTGRQGLLQRRLALRRADRRRQRTARYAALRPARPSASRRHLPHACRRSHSARLCLGVDRGDVAAYRRRSHALPPGDEGVHHPVRAAPGALAAAARDPRRRRRRIRQTSHLVPVVRARAEPLLHRPRPLDDGLRPARGQRPVGWRIPISPCSRSWATARC